MSITEILRGGPAASSHVLSKCISQNKLRVFRSISFRLVQQSILSSSYFYPPHIDVRTMDVVFVSQQWLSFCKHLFATMTLYALISSWMHSLCKWVFVHSEQSLGRRSFQLQHPIFHLPLRMWCPSAVAIRPLEAFVWELARRILRSGAPPRIVGTLVR